MIFHNFNSNVVREAVKRVGGPTKAAHAASVSNASIHNWIKQRRIKSIDKAKIIAKLSGFSVDELRGVL
ncbi:hypothetical protein QU487_04745 [Crenobacter sp. SG2305]|uniref:hypothetical protein n=1 Tax=Crenobacter oryzisoli TaxID=3056844 RepID=UPI0025AAC857|nr:hypothetical protein [Crenobacter sp. SG2305]MDN0082062.1 hypothetical protein [Crenobacter sp. SG2305]